MEPPLPDGAYRITTATGEVRPVLPAEAGTNSERGYGDASSNGNFGLGGSFEDDAARGLTDTIDGKQDEAQGQMDDGLGGNGGVPSL